MKIIKIILSLFLSLFGIVSIFMTSSIAFDWFGIREMEGNYVSFIVYVNMICGFIYLYAAYSIWKNKKSTIWALGLAFFLLVFAFIALGWYINEGGVYELKTLKAMSFRTIVTVALGIISYGILKKAPRNHRRNSF